MSINITVYNGVCNRLLPIISSIRLAKKSDRKNVNVTWTHTPLRCCLAPTSTEKCVFSDLFENVEGLTHEQPILNIGRTYCDNNIVDISGDCNINLIMNTYPLLSLDDISKGYDLTSKIDKSIKIIFEKYELELSNILKIFKPVSNLKNTISSIHQTFSKKMVGLHIRKTDGGFVDRVWDDIIKILLIKLKRWCEVEDNGVFLATDDYNAQQSFSCLGKKLVIYAPILSKFTNDKYSAICGIVDLYLLGKCDVIIGTSGSTFSICAMLLADNNADKYMINKTSDLDDINF